MKMNKGQVGSIGPLAMALIVAVLIVAMGSLVLNGFLTVGTNISGGAGAGATAFNSTITSGQSTMTTVSGFLPLVGLAVVAAIVIGLFMGFLSNRR